MSVTLHGGVSSPDVHLKKDINIVQELLHWLQTLKKLYRTLTLMRDEELLLRHFIVHKTLIFKLQILVFKYIIRFSDIQTKMPIRHFLSLTLLVSLGCHKEILYSGWLKQ